MPLPFYYAYQDWALYTGVIGHGVNALGCLVACVRRGIPRVQQIQPGLTAMVQVGFIIWWCSLCFNHSLGDLWKSIGLRCWYGSLGIRACGFALAASSLCVKQWVAYKKWDQERRIGDAGWVASAIAGDEEEERTRAALIVFAGFFVPWAGLMGLAAVLTWGGASSTADDDCGIPDAVWYIHETWQGMYLFVFTSIVITLFATVAKIPETTRELYLVIHPKRSDAVIELVCVWTGFVVHTGMHANHWGFAQWSEEFQANLETTLVAWGSPTIMLWLVLGGGFRWWSRIRGVASPDHEDGLRDSLREHMFDHTSGWASPQGISTLHRFRRKQQEGHGRLHSPRRHDRASPEASEPQTLFASGAAELMQCIRTGDVEDVKKLLIGSSLGIGLVNHPNDGGETPLHVATATRRRSMVACLLSCGARIENTDDEGCTPLHVAAAAGRDGPQLLQLFVRSLQTSDEDSAGLPALVNQVARNGSTALHICTAARDLDTIASLLGFGADPNACLSESVAPIPPEEWRARFRDQVGKFGPRKSSLLLACELNFIEAVRQFLRHFIDADLACVGPYLLTPLGVACYLGHGDLAALLLERGADPRYTQPHALRFSMLHCAAAGGDARALHCLILALLMRAAAAENPPSGLSHLVDQDSEIQFTTMSQHSTTWSSGPSLVDHSGVTIGSADDALRRTAAGLLLGTGSLLQLALAKDSRVASAAPTGREWAAVTDDDIWTATMTLAAGQNSLPALPEHEALLEALSVEWHVGPITADGGTAVVGRPKGSGPTFDLTLHLQESSDDLDTGSSRAPPEVQAIVEAVSRALRAPGSSLLLEVLKQDAFQWKGKGFAAPMTEAKARQLAAEIRSSVVHPETTLANIREREPILRMQCELLRKQGRGAEADRSVRAMGTLLRGADAPHDDDDGDEMRALSPAVTPKCTVRRHSVGAASSAQTSDELPAGALPVSFLPHLNKLDVWHRTPLHWACAEGNCGAAFMLCCLGADPDVRDRAGRRSAADILGLTALQYAQAQEVADADGVTTPRQGVAAAAREGLSLLRARMEAMAEPGDVDRSESSASTMKVKKVRKGRRRGSAAQ